MSLKVKCELGKVCQSVSGVAGPKLDSASGWVPEKANSELEANAQEFYYEMFVGLLPDKSR